MYMVDHPFIYHENLLNYPHEELAKVSQNNAMFNVWWNQAGFTRPVKKRRMMNGYGRLRGFAPLHRRRGGNLRLMSGYDAPYGGGYHGGTTATMPSWWVYEPIRDFFLVEPDR